MAWLHLEQGGASFPIFSEGLPLRVFAGFPLAFVGPKSALRVGTTPDDGGGGESAPFTVALPGFPGVSATLRNAVLLFRQLVVGSVVGMVL